jgi:hypothetical protein
LPSIFFAVPVSGLEHLLVRRGLRQEARAQVAIALVLGLLLVVGEVLDERAVLHHRVVDLRLEECGATIHEKTSDEFEFSSPWEMAQSGPAGSSPNERTGLVAQSRELRIERTERSEQIRRRIRSLRSIRQIRFIIDRGDRDEAQSSPARTRRRISE